MNFVSQYGWPSSTSTRSRTGASGTRTSCRLFAVVASSVTGTSDTDSRTPVTPSARSSRPSGRGVSAPIACIASSGTGTGSVCSSERSTRRSAS